MAGSGTGDAFRVSEICITGNMWKNGLVQDRNKKQAEV